MCNLSEDASASFPFSCSDIVRPPFVLQLMTILQKHDWSRGGPRQSTFIFHMLSQRVMLEAFLVPIECDLHKSRVCFCIFS